MKCPLCGDGTMIETRGNQAWKCDFCEARLLADASGDSAEAIWRAEQAYKYMISKRGGGSKSGGRMKRDKKKDKRRPPYMLE